MSDLSHAERGLNAQSAYSPVPVDMRAAARVKSVLEATAGRPDIEILLALGEAITGDRRVWLAEVEHQMPGLLGRGTA